MMNSRLSIILLLIAIGLGSWYYSLQNNQSDQLSQLIKKEGEAEYSGERMTTMVYTLKGEPQYFAQANVIKRYESTERTEFLQPLVELFDQKTAQKQWKVTADYAEITKDKMLNLRGNVKINGLEPNSRLQKIETEQLSIDLNTQDIYSESLVKSIGMGFTTEGKGLTGNLKKQVATLTKDVKTYIEPTVIKQTNEDSTLK